MADLTADPEEVVRRMTERQIAPDMAATAAVAGDPDVIVLKAPAGAGELVDVEDAVDFMAGHGFHMARAPGAGAADAQYQFIRE